MKLNFDQAVTDQVFDTWLYLWLGWIERLAGEELSPEDRKLIAESLKRALFRDLPGAGLPAR
ncbi:MAG: hypothetical protein WCK35_20630 [Chloroflexota bacterium]